MDATAVSRALTGASHSGYYVEDLDRTTEFYTKVLGAKLEWRNDKSKNPLMKLYIGDFGMSIIKRPPDDPKVEIPHAIHIAFRADPSTAEQMIEHVKSCGVEVEGPIGHKREVGIVNWFFQDPDGFRLEIEARYPSAEEQAAVLERGKAGRNEEMGLYGGDQVLKKIE